MKLSASYNLWDCEYLIEESIRQIRCEVDYISIVYQTVSNFGRYNDFDYLKFLIRLLNDGLIDDFESYKPNITLPPQANEIIKRNIGIKMALKKGCTHHISMDSDEFYLPSQFKNAKELIISENLNSTSVGIQTYWKSAMFRFREPENYMVSFIDKINDKSAYYYNAPYYCMVDPTRRIGKAVDSGNYKILPTSLVEMHHMSYVRKDIMQKYINSSSYYSILPNIENTVTCYNEWNNRDMYVSMIDGSKKQIEKVKPLFNIFLT